MPVSRPKILLADDSITIQKVVNLTFADHGMDVVTFADGNSAVEELDHIKPDIVLADVNMPGINGYQLCELMRNDEANRNTPVVLLVGSFEPFDRDEAQRVGSNAFLTKPFTSIAELISTVQGLLDERTSTDASSAETLETSVDAPEPSMPVPDTSDIDHLYQQSFVETVELPRSDDLNGDFGNGIDDEMIQTSYAEPDAELPEEDTYFAAEPDDELLDSEIRASEFETESPIPESMPEEAEDLAETHEPVTEPEPEPEISNDPFESVAAEPPPVSHEEDISTGDTVRFDFDDDLLELPGSASPQSTHVAVESTPPAAQPQQITELSPELIDLIVEKVVERLAKKY